MRSPTSTIPEERQLTPSSTDEQRSAGEPNLDIVRATRDDIESLVELVQSAYRGEASRMGWTTEAELLGGQRTDRDEITQLVSHPGTRILLARVGGELLGCVCMKPEDTSVYVGMLAVQPRRQGAGLGRSLLAAVEDLVLSERLPRRLRMTVIAQRSELIAWYERCGYHKTGEREPFPYGNERFGLPLRPDLYFEVLEKLIP